MSKTLEIPTNSLEAARRPSALSKWEEYVACLELFCSTRDIKNLLRADRELPYPTESDLSLEQNDEE